MRLRKILGTTAIETTPHGYRLAVPADEVDSRRFEQLVTKGHQLLALGEPDRAVKVFRDGLALWRGRALAEVDEWGPGQLEAMRLDELRRECDESVLDASLRIGLNVEVLAEARQWAAESPCASAGGRCSR